MPRLSRFGVVLLAAGLLLTGGCQRFKYETDIDLKPEEMQFRTIDGFRSDNKVKVTVTSSDSPVIVAIIPEAQYEEASGINFASVVKGWSKNAYEITKDPSKDITLTANIPGKKDFRICIYAEHKTTVHLKVINE